MRNIKPYYCGLILLAACLTACQPSPDATDATGHPIRISDYQGKWVVINYWATWCKPCLTELPELNALYHAQTDKVMVLGVSFDGLPDTQLRAFAATIPVDFPLLTQFPLSKWGVHDIPSLPVTFMLNPEGKLVHTLYGPQTQQTLLKAMELP